MDRGMFRDWSHLDRDILLMILERLELSSDYLRFSIVCKWWHNVAKHERNLQNFMSSVHEPPMLLFHTNKDDAWNLYSVVENKILETTQFEVAKIYKRFIGSSKGWLIAVDENLGINLINPFLRIKGRKTNENSIIHLPTFNPPSGIEDIWRNNYEQFVFKATITTDPIMNPDDCIVVLMYMPRCEIAFIRVNKDVTWTYSADYSFVQDVIFVNRKFYVVDNKSSVSSFNSLSRTISVDVEIPRKLSTDPYLVDSNDGNLLLVHRYAKHPNKKRVTKRFQIFEFDFATSTWLDKDTLDANALFLGSNSSICVQASKFPGCEPNHVYFLDDRDHITDSDKPRDFGLYNYKTHKFVVPYSPHVYNLIKRTMRFPIWIVPNFYM